MPAWPTYCPKSHSSPCAGQSSPPRADSARSCLRHCTHKHPRYVSHATAASGTSCIIPAHRPPPLWPYARGFGPASPMTAWLTRDSFQASRTPKNQIWHPSTCQTPYLFACGQGQMESARCPTRKTCRRPGRARRPSFRRTLALPAPPGCASALVSRDRRACLASGNTRT